MPRRACDERRRRPPGAPDRWRERAPDRRRVEGDGRIRLRQRPELEGMLWGVAVRSPLRRPDRRRRHAAARAAPGVAAVLLAADPGKTTFGLEISDQPVLADDVVRYDSREIAVGRRREQIAAHRRRQHTPPGRRPRAPRDGETPVRARPESPPW